MKWWISVGMVMAAMFAASCASSGTVEKSEDEEDQALPSIGAESVLETLQESLEHHEPALQACIEESGVDQAKLAEGRVEYELVVDETFNAVAVEVSSSTVDQPELESCMADHLRESWGGQVAGEPTYTTEFEIRFWPMVERGMCRVFYTLDEVSEEKAERIREIEEQAECAGEFCDREEIKLAISKHHDEFRRCYDSWLSDNLAGAGGYEEIVWYGIGLLVNFRIGPSVSAYNIRVRRSSLTSVPAELEECIVDVFGEIDFADPGDGLCVVNYPFHFRGLGRPDSVGLDLRL